MTNANQSIAFVRLNVQFSNAAECELNSAKIQEALDDAATWANAEDCEIFYAAEVPLFGINIAVDGDLASVFEAGQVLGICQRIIEEEELGSSCIWSSIHSSNGDVIYSPI
jgi:hypothetical protein